LDSNLTSTYLSKPTNNDQIILFPNPSSKTVFIKTHSLLFDQIKIFDQAGKLQIDKTFKSFNLHQVNTSTLKNGFYIVGLYHDGEHIKSMKMIITESNKK
jgi:hypothetical protein